MIYWLSGSLVILVLVTVLLTPESNITHNEAVEKTANSEVVKTTNAANDPIQSQNITTVEKQVDKSVITADSNTDNLTALVDSKSNNNNIYGDQVKETNNTGGKTVRVLLIPDRETTVSRSGSSLAATRIKKLNVTLGSTFNAGNTLIKFDCNEPRARLAMAKAELSSAIETHTAKVRMQGLEQAGDVEVALAASDVAKARATVKLSEAQIRYCSVTAPWDGRVAKVYVRNHMTVTPGEPMLDLVKSGPLRLKVNIPSKLLSKIKVESIFEVTIDETGKKYQASVVAINSRVDSVSQTVEIEGLMAESFPELLAGMSGTAIMPEM